MEARSRAHGPRGKRHAERVVFYGCAAYHRRGAVVCANRQTVSRAATDHAVLSAVESTILNPEVLAVAIGRLADELSTPEQFTTVDLERELSRLDEELTRLTAAVAGGGNLPSLLAALHEREERRWALQVDLAARRSQHRQTVDRKAIVRDLSARVAEWRTLLASQPEQANRLLRQVLLGKLTMTPVEEGYRFEGVGTVEPILAGLVPHNLASPTGFEPVS